MASRFSSQVLWFQQHKLPKFKKSTTKTMQGHLANYLLPAFANHTLGMLTPKRVNEWLSSDAVSHLAPKSQKHLITTLSLVTGVKFSRGVIRYPAPKAYREEAACFTPGQMTSIIEGSAGLYKVLYAIASETGMRAGELYGLELTDIDWIRSQIHVRRSVFDGELQSPKSKNAYRVIPVKPWLLELIKQYVGERKTGLIFLNKRGHAMRHTTVLRRHFHPLLAKLGIAQCGLHAFRHARVSYLVQCGVPREVIKKWVGHGSDAMIELYLHLSPNYQAAALDKVGSLQPNSPFTSGNSLATGAQVM
jgi:integrase